MRLQLNIWERKKRKKGKKAQGREEKELVQLWGRLHPAVEWDGCQ